MDGQKTEARGMLCFARTFNPAGCVGKDWRMLPVEESGFVQGSKELTNSLLRFRVSWAT